MLTSAQVAVIARRTEDGDYLHTYCEEDEPTYPATQYELDEWDGVLAQDYFSDEDGHEAYCSCTRGVQCCTCGRDIIEPYSDPQCEEVGIDEDE